MKDKGIKLIGAAMISVSIIIAAFIVSKEKPVEKERYTIVPLNEGNVAVIDHEQNRIYYKYIPSFEGPTNWTELVLP